MNRLLVHYCVDVQHPEVSGAEHLEMLQIRDRLAELESTLTSEEQQARAEADRVLVAESSAFYQELLRFLDLAAYRREHGIPPARWWWYLDVISHLPPLKDEAPDIRHPTPPVCKSATKDCDQDPVPPKVLPDLPTAATFIADKVDWAPLGAPRS